MAATSPLEFGVRWTLPDYLREVQKGLGADLTQFNGEDSWTLPMPARYVIAQDGKSLTPRSTPIIPGGPFRVSTDACPSAG